MRKESLFAVAMIVKTTTSILNLSVARKRNMKCKNSSIKIPDYEHLLLILRQHIGFTESQHNF